MLAKKHPGTPSDQTSKTYNKELQYLYERRTAIDELIRSLQEYDLSRVRWDNFAKRQTA